MQLSNEYVRDYVTWIKRHHSSFCSPKKCQNSTCYFKRNGGFFESCSRGNWGRTLWIQKLWDCNPLPTLWSRNGHVSGSNPGLYHHDDRPLVQWRLPQVYYIENKWSSLAAMWHKEWTQRMIKNLMYRHILEIEPQVSHLDPCQRNHPDNTKTRRNIGGSLSRCMTLSPFFRYNWRFAIFQQYLLREWIWWWTQLSWKNLDAGDTLLSEVSRSRHVVVILFLVVHT